MKIIIGPIVHSVKRGNVTTLQNSAIVVKDGKIEAVLEVCNASQLADLEGKYPASEVTRLTEGQFLIPGLIDTHVHGPQFPQAGLGYDKTLLDWLNTYTFPLESKYNNIVFAKHVYEDVVKKTLGCGTTSAVYFGTIHRDGSLELARAAHRQGQRALVGKVNMDMNSPPQLTEGTDDSVQETEKFIQDVLALKSSLVKPVVTPRFAYSCSASLLKKLGALRRRLDLHVQTHISENKEEVKEVRKLFPSSSDYTDVYDQANLLSRKTILAHGVYLSDSELEVIRQRGSSVAHCPDSNILLRSGLCDVRRLLNAEVNVALGTDVAGGSSPSVLDAIRLALTTSISLSFSREDYSPLNYHEAFYLATVGGAVALDMENELGNFAVGKYFDAIIVDMKDSIPAPDPGGLLSRPSVSELFQKFIYTGDDRNVLTVFVNGKIVVDKS